MAKPNCDFTPFAKSLRGGRPNYVSLRYIAKLSTVKGRYYVSLGELDQASTSYLNVVALAKHLPQQNKLLIAKMIDIALIEIVTLPIKALVHEKGISKETLTKIDKQLHDYELHSVTLTEVFQAYKYEMKNEVKEWLNEVHKQVLIQGKYKLSSSDRKFLYDTTLTEAEALINTYMGYYIKAAQTNNTADWDFAEKEFMRFSESATSNSSSYYVFLGKYWLYSKIKKKAALDETAKMQAKMIVDMLLPSGKRAGEQYYSAMNRIKEVRELIAKRVH